MLGALTAGLVCSSAVAQPGVSQAAGARIAIVDEFGNVLQGTDPYAHQYGIASVEGDLVQILLARDNTVYPPAADGMPDSRNVVLMTTRIGLGISPTLGQSGRFSAKITPRPGGNSRIFARVFNAPSLEEASFYGDSDLFKVLSWRNDIFVVEIAATDIPLDPQDADGDGVNNSWERSYGTDAEAADSDGDGLTDGEEILARTDPLERDDALLIVDVLPIGGDDALLSWDSKEGVHYRVEMATGGLHESPSFDLLDTVVGEADTTTLKVVGGLSHQRACFRVLVVAE